jgi:hypothetical protein
MGCATTTLPGVDGVAFICGAGIVPCAVCGHVAEALCDYPMGAGKTCDLPLCGRHRVAQGGDLEDIDFCPAHVLVALGRVSSGEVD